jgi:hypothetical protein
MRTSREVQVLLARARARIVRRRFPFGVSSSNEFASMELLDELSISP